MTLLVSTASMKLLLLVVHSVAGVLTSPASAEEPELAPDRPDVVFILADDLGWGDLKCYGHPYSRTPNLDRLASEGTRFTQFYSTGVTCCPAHTGLMNGRFSGTFEKYPVAFGFSVCPCGRFDIESLVDQKGPVRLS